jgi:hypothetical protein
MGGSLTFSELYDTLMEFDMIQNKKCVLKAFVETGSYKGDSAMIASLLFNRVFSIEIDKNRHKECLERIEKLDPQKSNEWNVGFIHGSSTDVLEDLISAHKEESMFFFLDAHRSGSTPPEEKRPDDPADVPLLEELIIIDETYPDTHEAIVCIDDVRLFDNFSDWEGITKESIMDCFSQHEIILASTRNDRFWIVLGSAPPTGAKTCGDDENKNIPK